MRLLLVDSNEDSLESYARRLQETTPVIEGDLELCLQLADEDDYLTTITESDIVLFGPGMEEMLEETASAIHATCPTTSVLAFADRNRDETSSGISAVFPLEAEKTLLEAELARILNKTLEVSTVDEPEEPLVEASDTEAEQFVDPVDHAVVDEEDLLFGRYQALEAVGSGSVSTVFRCLDKQNSDQEVAVRVLFPDVASDPTSAARLRNEYRATQSLEHPNVVKTYEYLEEGEDSIGIAMEFVDGSTLAERLHSKLPIEEILDLLSQASAGLQALHSTNIIHRNIKPENILVSKDGVAKISDSGIARFEGGAKLTQDGSVLGALNYVCPEYVLESKIDWRADIYALGVIAYEMVAGRVPFEGSSIFDVMNQCIKGEVDPPSHHNPDCSSALDEVILKALRKDPEERYQSLAEMHNALQKVRSEAAAPDLPIPRETPDLDKIFNQQHDVFSYTKPMRGELSSSVFDSSAVKAVTRRVVTGNLRRPSMSRNLIYLFGGLGVGIFAALVVLFIVLPVLQLMF